MKICYLIHNFNFQNIFAGTQTYLNKIVEFFSKKLDIYIYTSKNSRFFTKQEFDRNFDNFHLHIINTNYNFFKKPKKENFGQTKFDKILKEKFEIYLKKTKPDLVHIIHLLGLSDTIFDVLKKFKIPFGFSFYDFYPICPKTTLLKPDFSVCPKAIQEENQNCSICWPKKFNEWFGQRLNFWKKSLESAKFLLAPSFFVKTIISKNFPSLERKIEVLKPFISISPQNQKTSFSQKKCLNFGYLGAIYPEKGIYFLIDVFKSLKTKNANLHIFGYPAGLKEKIKLKLKIKKQKNIFYHGPYQYSKLNQIFSNIDATIVPSFLLETFCFVVYESLSFGIPSIVSDRGALPQQILEEKNGFIFKAGSFYQLKNILKNIIENPSLLNSLKIEKKEPSSNHYDLLFKKYLEAI